MFAVDDDLEAIVLFGPLFVESFLIFFIRLRLVFGSVLCVVVAFVVVVIGGGAVVGSVGFGV